MMLIGGNYSLDYVSQDDEGCNYYSCDVEGDVNNGAAN